jgi:hypothetical protein
MLGEKCPISPAYRAFINVEKLWTLAGKGEQRTIPVPGCALQQVRYGTVGLWIRSTVFPVIRPLVCVRERERGASDNNLLADFSPSPPRAFTFSIGQQQEEPLLGSQMKTSFACVKVKIHGNPSIRASIGGASGFSSRGDKADDSLVVVRRHRGLLQVNLSRVIIVE